MNEIQRFKGYFLFKKRWYSICSTHQVINNDCSLCRTGNYRNTTMLKIESYIYKYLPRLWFFMNNSHMPIKKRIKESRNFKKV